MSKITATVNEIADRLGVEYITASALVKLLVAQGAAKEVDKRSSSNGRGKPSTVYELESKITLDFDHVGVKVETVVASTVSKDGPKTIVDRVASKKATEIAKDTSEDRLETKVAA